MLLPQDTSGLAIAGVILLVVALVTSRRSRIGRFPARGTLAISGLGLIAAAAIIFVGVVIYNSSRSMPV